MGGQYINLFRNPFLGGSPVSTSGFARSGLIAVFAGLMLSSISSVPFQANAAASSGVKLHSKAPDFTLMDDAGQPFKLSDHLGKGKVVIFFYMSDNATNCTDE